MRCIEINWINMKIQNLERLTLTWDVLKSKNEKKGD